MKINATMETAKDTENAEDAEKKDSEGTQIFPSLLRVLRVFRGNLVTVFKMKRPILHHLFLAIAVLTSLARAESEPLSLAQAKALRTRFETRQRDTTSWTAAFTQTLTMPGLRASIASEGTLTFRAPDALRIEFTKPAGELVLILGDRFFLRKPAKRVVEKSLSRDNAGKPFQALMNLFQGRPPENEAQFEPRVTNENESYIITLTKKPEATGKLPKRITNIVSESTLDVREVFVELPAGGSLRYVFNDPARNRPVAAKLFAAPVEGRD